MEVSSPEPEFAHRSIIHTSHRGAAGVCPQWSLLCVTLYHSLALLRRCRGQRSRYAFAFLSTITHITYQYHCAFFASIQSQLHPCRVISNIPDLIIP